MAGTGSYFSAATRGNKLKIVVTGATGDIGQSIVQFLNNQGHQLLLVGRDTQRLKKTFGKSIASVNYDRWHKHAQNFDAVIHLATRTKSQIGSLQEFRQANVILLQEIVREMRGAGILKLIFFTCLHVKEVNRSDLYSITKREAEAWLDTQSQVEITKFRLPAVYTENTSESLRYINHLPRCLQTGAFYVSKCLRPMVTIETVLNGLERTLTAPNQHQEILLSDQQRNNPVYTSVKRIMDFSAGIVIAVLLSWWLLIAIWLIIKLTSKGPGIFAQKRVGKDQKVFLCYKFRTMQAGTVQAGTHEISTSNITGVGKFLRKTKLDELPQFVNLLKNEMSLIGPRPCLPNQNELIEEREKRKIFTIKPGVSGLGQVKNVDMSDPKKLAEIDAFYLDTRTIFLDIRLILATLFKRFRRSLNGV